MLVLFFRLLILLAIILLIYTWVEYLRSSERKMRIARNLNTFYFDDEANNSKKNLQFVYRGCLFEGEKYLGITENSFEVLNPFELEIKKGSVVVVSTNKKFKVLQGIFSLLIPFLCAVAGYISGPSICAFFGKTISNDARALFVLLFLALSSAVIFAITRKNPMPGKPEIVEVI